jgi:hypothetical protein
MKSDIRYTVPDESTRYVFAHPALDSIGIISLSRLCTITLFVELRAMNASFMSASPHLAHGSENAPIPIGVYTPPREYIRTSTPVGGTYLSRNHRTTYRSTASKTLFRVKLRLNGTGRRVESSRIVYGCDRCFGRGNRVQSSKTNEMLCAPLSTLLRIR